MDILIIRHGDAVDDAPGMGDAGRWLTGKGRRVTREVAAWLLRDARTRPREIWTSPLVRAVQTAEIIAEATGLLDEVSVRRELATSGDPNDVLALLERYDGDGPIALVGHEPSLSDLAVLLRGGGVWPGFKKSGVAAMEWDRRGSAQVRFLLDPKDMKLRTSF